MRLARLRCFATCMDTRNDAWKAPRPKNSTRRAPFPPFRRFDSFPTPASSSTTLVFNFTDGRCPGKPNQKKSCPGPTALPRHLSDQLCTPRSLPRARTPPVGAEAGSSSSFLYLRSVAYTDAASRCRWCW